MKLNATLLTEVRRQVDPGKVFIYKIRAKYLTCKGGDESSRAEDTENMRNMSK